MPEPVSSTRRFDMLPKIHKEIWPSPIRPPCRPIVSDVNTNSSNIAKFIEFYLFLIASSFQGFLLDSSHLIAILRSTTFRPSSILCTFDVRSLYTNIPISEGINRVSHAFDRFPQPQRPKEAILQLLRLSLERNDFCFRDTYWLQTKGVAMGKSFGGSFTNIYLGYWE